ncbi:MAG: hypothetical protein GEU79_14185 [Acidimicrobiia bacterium]|nr:hypothetical protein [Acidimicrobiia bacterium]
MRDLELVLGIGCLVAVLWPAIFGVRSYRGLMATCLVVLVSLQLIFEDYRWQMLPLLITAAGLAVGDLLAPERELVWWRRLSRFLFGPVGLAVVVALAVIFPVPELPAPTGPQPIGTMSFVVTGPEHFEVFDNPGEEEPREIPVQVWYPSQPTDDEPMGWSSRPDEVAERIALAASVPGWALSHLDAVSSHAVPDAPMLEGTLPVIIYSHGWSGFRAGALNQIESLASQGYIVIAPDHLHLSVASVFPDGSVVGLDEEALPPIDQVVEEEYWNDAERLVETMSEDQIVILDALASGNGLGEVAEHADMGRIAIFGHSAGGGAAILTCLFDARCDGVVGFDPWVEPLDDRAIGTDPDFPLMVLRSDEWRNTQNDAVLRGIAERNRDVAYWIGINGAQHSDFTLTALLSPYGERLGLNGTIPVDRMIAVVDSYLRGFMDVHLLGAGSAALETAEFQGVDFELMPAAPAESESEDGDDVESGAGVPTTTTTPEDEG